MSVTTRRATILVFGLPSEDADELGENLEVLLEAHGDPWRVRAKPGRLLLRIRLRLQKAGCLIHLSKRRKCGLVAPTFIPSELGSAGHGPVSAFAELALNTSFR